MKNENTVQWLESSGLSVVHLDMTPYFDRLFPNGKIPDGEVWEYYYVAKPKSVSGNTRPAYEIRVGCGETQFISDAPLSSVRYIPSSKHPWCFCIHEFLGRPGPGDFYHYFKTLEEAFVAVQEYYFGDPTLMYPPELIAHEEAKRKHQDALEVRRQLFDIESRLLPIGPGWKFILFRVMPWINRTPPPYYGPTTWQIITPVLRLFYWRMHREGWRFYTWVIQDDQYFWNIGREVPKNLPPV